MTRLDLNNPLHAEILIALGENGMASGIAKDFDINAFIEETATITLDDTPKDPS